MAFKMKGSAFYGKNPLKQSKMQEAVSEEKASRDPNVKAWTKDLSTLEKGKLDNRMRALINEHLQDQQAPYGIWGQKKTGYSKVKSDNLHEAKKAMGAKSPLFQKDKFGKIEKDVYPNLVEDVSEVQEDEKGLYTTGLSGGTGHHTESDTTRYPKGFSDYKGLVKKGDYIDETTHDAWMGVDVEDHSDPYEGQKATGVRKVWDKIKKKYVDYKEGK